MNKKENGNPHRKVVHLLEKTSPVVEKLQRLFELNKKDYRF
jgi:hypothetical protein